MTRMMKWIAIANWILAGALLILNIITVQAVCHPSNPFYKIFLLHLRNAAIPYAMLVHGRKCYIVARINRDQVPQEYWQTAVWQMSSFFMLPATLLILGPSCPSALLALLGNPGWTSSAESGDDDAVTVLATVFCDNPWIGGLGPFNPSFIVPPNIDCNVLKMVGFLTRITCSAIFTINTVAGAVLRYDELVARWADEKGMGISGLGKFFLNVVRSAIYTALTVVYEGMVVIGDIWEFLYSTINRFRLELVVMCE